jgi:hypothetical protein
MREIMKIIQYLFLLFSIPFWAASTPSALKKYSIDVHVSSSMRLMEPWDNGPIPVLRLHVIINGTKYTLDAITSFSFTKVMLLAPGDYQARLVRDVHPTAYKFSKIYEFLFPDGKTRKFVVVGQGE